MNDDDRAQLAVRKGATMLGPLEKERCSRHPRRWRTYRWTWRADDGDISSSEPVIVRDCAACIEVYRPPSPRAMRCRQNPTSGA